MIDNDYQEAVKDIKKALTVLENKPVVLDNEKIKHPDPTRHLYISLTKSLIRIAAGVALIMNDLLLAGGLLVFAEVLGIAEELV
jgi:hypothetical protein